MVIEMQNTFDEWFEEKTNKLINIWSES